MVWYGRTMHERARSTQSSMSANAAIPSWRDLPDCYWTKERDSPPAHVLDLCRKDPTFSQLYEHTPTPTQRHNDDQMTWHRHRTWFQLQQQTAATSAKTWLIRWIPCPCFDPYPTTFGLPILGHLEHGRVYFITAPSLKGTRTLLVSNEAVTAHQQQHRHIMIPASSLWTHPYTFPLKKTNCYCN